jgi:hypothetical protein
VPCEVDEKLLVKRFGIAFQLSQDHKPQNEDPVFCAHAQKILNKSREILKDRRKESAYSAWVRARPRDETKHAEAEKAQREAEGERQKRRALEEKLAEAERQRASQETSKQPTDRKFGNPARYVVWLGIVLVVGLFLQLSHQHAASNEVATIRATPNEPTPRPEIRVAPETSPSVTPEPAPSLIPKATPNLTPQPAPSLTPEPTPSLTPKATANPTPDATWPDGRILSHSEHPINTGVVNVNPNDTLKLRRGPGTRFNAVAEVPANATDISAYDQDQVWDGDTWWCPVEWRGFRGYVGRSYLPTDTGPTPAANAAVWPDGRILTHPEHSVNSAALKVKPNDTLKLRGGPGTRFNPVAQIPANATDISAFDQDQVWDGDTWWCPVEWQGFRGYVGRSHLSTTH